ncbi:MAG: hypothetical protein U0234_04660 [Sandaracinus sp.]
MALVVHLEELLRDRRVLLVGDTSTRVERRLSDAARTVDVVSREKRARRRGLPVRAWPTPAEKGTWDAIVVPDLVAAGLAEAGRFDEIAALAAEGVLVVATDAAGEPGYEAFHALVSARFEHVRVFGQAPLAGFALAELGGATAEVAYDASSVELAPARFVAVVAPRSAVLDGYAVIVTPRVEGERAQPDPRFEREAEAARTRLEHAEKRLEQAQREIARSAQKLDEARHEQARLEEALRESQAERESAEGGESEAVEAARAECDALEARLRTAARELTALRAENERRAVLVRDLVEESRTRAAESAIGVAVPSRAAIDAELARAQEALQSAQRRAVEAETRRAELAFQVDELKADLASIGQAHEAKLAALRAELASPPAPVVAPAPVVEAIATDATELARALDRASASEAAVAELERRLSHAVTAAAAAEARVAELERRLSQAVTAAAAAEARVAELGLALAARDHEIARLVEEHASAEGSARGLAAKVAELHELRRVAESRLALVEDDVRRGEERTRELERRLAESEEQLELARMPRPAPSRENDADATRAGQLFGALMRAREQLEETQRERTELLGEVARLRTALEIAAHAGDAELAEARRRAATAEAEVDLRSGQLSHRNSELETVRGERDTLATRVVALESVMPPPMLLEPEPAPETDDHEAQLDALRGECTGLRLRAADADASASAARASLLAVSARIATAEAAARSDARRVAESAARLAARDALVSRLESELAQASERDAGAARALSALEARLATATESIGALEAVSSVRSDEERRERDAALRELATEKERSAHYDTERASALEALRDVRESLSRLTASLAEERASAIPAAPDSVYREEIGRLSRDVEDRELMLRSLTAQLEDRDDRIRALERVARGDSAAPDPTKLLEAEERIARLTAELAQERKARERVESSSALVSREAELRRLEQLVGDRDAQLMLLEGRVEGAAREEKVMRDSFAEARAALETILGDLGNDRQGQAVERAAELLRALRRF